MFSLLYLASSPHNDKSINFQMDSDSQKENISQRFELYLRIYGDEPMELNVGGKHYCTTMRTLCSVPHSHLWHMFNDDKLQKDKDGRVFIDRDGDIFQYILDFLRNGYNAVLPADTLNREKLMGEAKFYGLDQLVEMIDTATDRGIELDVGGRVYGTSLHTLRSVSGSNLNKMINEDKMRDGQGRTMIDRDGEAFAYILDYLRNKNKVVLPADDDKNKCLRDKIKREAEHYGLPELVELLSTNIQSQKTQQVTVPSETVVRRPKDMSPTVQQPIKNVASEFVTDRHKPKLDPNFDIGNAKRHGSLIKYKGRWIQAQELGIN